jgi:copper chaperone CopZ
MKSKLLVFALACLLVVAFSPIGVIAAIRSSTFRVEGMNSKTDSAVITRALKSTAGVTRVQVSLKRSEVVVQFDDEKTSENKLREVINSTGFKTVP